MQVPEQREATLIVQTQRQELQFIAILYLIESLCPLNVHISYYYAHMRESSQTRPCTLLKTFGVYIIPYMYLF